MIRAINRHSGGLLDFPSGSRFIQWHDQYRAGAATTERARHRAMVAWLVRAGLGIALVALGVLMLVIPGPGLLVIVLGLAVLGSVWSPVARVMDWLELRVLRFLRWLRRQNIAVQAVAGLLVLAGCAGALYVTWLLTFG